eukprot:TRINITY_DN4918_c0_g1_i1.p1 TRINITY_DN4918_c0_g1~~TRINITY_DN4918_c0_g1_i1.p1  ORF type:complete len:338 (-),score=72.11 TRINITY_DN4918_c0_g1_i1:46-1059(-)
MADHEEKKKYQWWTVDELEILLAYVQKQAPNEKPNYLEVVDLLAAEGYERTEKQVQKKFEKMRWQSKAENKDIETRLQEMIAALKFRDDEDQEEAPIKSPKATTPKSKQDQANSNEHSKEIWNVRDNEILLECLLAGHDKTPSVHDRMPYKPRDKVQTKLTNVKAKARSLGITPVELMKRQIKRLTVITGGEQSSEEEEKTPAKKGTKRKLEENHNEERSAKKQRVVESPRLTGPKNYDSATTDNSTDLKQLRNYIREKFEESRNQFEELRTQMTNIEDKLDVIINEMRASRANGNSTTPGKLTPAAQLVNKDKVSNKSQTPDSSPSKQQVSFIQFL